MPGWLLAGLLQWRLGERTTVTQSDTSHRTWEPVTRVDVNIFADKTWYALMAVPVYMHTTWRSTPFHVPYPPMPKLFSHLSDSNSRSFILIITPTTQVTSLSGVILPDASPKRALLLLLPLPALLLADSDAMALTPVCLLTAVWAAFRRLSSTTVM